MELHCLVVDSQTAAENPKTLSTKSVLEQSKMFRKSTTKMAADAVTQMDLEKASKVIGIDFGERYAVGAVCKSIPNYHVNNDGHLDYDGTIVNLKVSNAALAQPTRKFSKWLQSIKTDVINFINDRKFMRKKIV